MARREVNMNETTEVWAKLWLSLLAAAVVAWRHRASSRQPPEAAGTGLLFMAFLAVVGYYNFRTFHGASFVHYHEHFHYFLSAKYFPELGYDGLYVASLAAQRERAPGTKVDPHVQDLRRNVIVDVAAAEPHLREVVARFTPARWSRFGEDHQRFLEASEPSYFAAMRLDHGFNAPPTWAFVGRTLTRWIPATPGWLTLLASLDAVLLALALLAVGRVYGARTACLALIVFGLAYPSRFAWTGGGLLRYDWLAATLAAACLLRARRPATAGALLAYAAMVRVFPALLLFGPAVLALAEWRRGRDLRWARRLAAGFAGMVIVCLAAGALAGRGVGAWAEFARDVRQHHGTWLTNNVGLSNVFTFTADPGTLDRRYLQPALGDPWLPWEEAMERAYQRRRPLIVAAGALFLLLAGAAAAAAPRDEALVLGLPVVFALTLLTSYYWALLALLPLRRPSGPATAAFLLVNAALYGVHLQSPAAEVQYAATSWGLAAFFTVWVARAAGRQWAGLPAATPAGPREAAATAPPPRTPPAGAR
jgi:hypothetical protein